MGMKIVPEIYHLLPNNPVEMLLLCFDGQDDIAAFCAVTPQAVWNWKNRDSIPKLHVSALSEYSGIPTWMLCPKHFEKGESVVDIQSDSQGGGEVRPVQREAVGK